MLIDHKVLLRRVVLKRETSPGNVLATAVFFFANVRPTAGVHVLEDYEVEVHCAVNSDPPTITRTTHGTWRTAKEAVAEVMSTERIQKANLLVNEEHEQDSRVVLDKAAKMQEAHERLRAHQREWERKAREQQLAPRRALFARAMKAQAAA